MNADQVRASAEAAAGELIVVAGSPEMVDVRAAVVHSVISDRALPFGTDATIAQTLEHVGIVLSIVTMALGKALDELHALDPDDIAWSDGGGSGA